LNRKVLAAGLLFALPLLALLVLNLGRDPHEVASPLIGKPAPPFQLSPVGGGPEVSLAALRGRPAVINFWATWCVPCYQEHPVLVRAARELAPQVQFVGIVYDDEEARVKEFLERKGGGYPSLLDPEGRTAIAYGVYGVPETYFVDGQGTIVAKHVGPLDAGLLADNLRKAGGGAP
jgi:cytochrome c biogenesis protein CcmG/thiol:disulfide interchange protein DsbE